MAIWLTDNLHPLNVYLSPNIPKGKGFRELTDVLLSYQFGSVLIESKSLTIFGRETIPNRAKLAHDLLKHIKKAVNQLKGGINQLRKGVTVTTTSGAIINVERTQPVHAIVMVPDLDIIDDHELFGLSMIQDFMKETSSFIHLVDIAELLRIVQAAEIIASRGKNTTPMMAFDYFLIERAKKSYNAGTLCIKVLLKKK
jgi:PHP family Zn ribbon phosphoesterase